MSWQQVQNFKYWDCPCPRALGVCQKPQDPRTVRNFVTFDKYHTKTCQDSEFLGKFQLPTVPGPWDFAKHLKIPGHWGLYEEKYDPRTCWESGSLGKSLIQGLSQDLGTLPKSSRFRDSEVFDEEKYNPRLWRDSWSLGKSQHPRTVPGLWDFAKNLKILELWGHWRRKYNSRTCQDSGSLGKSQRPGTVTGHWDFANNVNILGLWGLWWRKV